MRYAQVDRAGVVVTFLSGAPDDWPDLRDAGVLRPCGEDVGAGWLWTGTGFDPPAAIEPLRTVAPLDFRRRFTSAERGAITLAASRGLEAGDPTLQVWLDDLNSATTLNLDSPELRAALDAMVATGLLAADRIAELLA